MKRSSICSVVLLAVALSAPALLADVKTRQHTTTKFEGLVGSFMNRAAGGADGLTATVSVKGDRMARLDENGGQIIDLAGQNVYNLDVKRKEYTVITFAEMRKQFEDARAQLAKQQQQMNPADTAQAADAAKELEFDVNVRDTGQKKTIAGQDTREVVLTVAMRAKGQTLEAGGGMVTTNTLWLAARVPALDELNAFNVRFAKALFEGGFGGMDMQQMNALSATLPGVGTLMTRMAEESGKLQGTPLSTTTVIESVKSAAQMSAASAPPPAAGGGLGGMLAGRLGRGRGQTQARSIVMTTSRETLSIDSAVSDADVALPAGFRLKK